MFCRLKSHKSRFYAKIFGKTFVRQDKREKGVDDAAAVFGAWCLKA